MSEQQDLDSKTLIAAPGIDRKLVSAPKARLTSSNPSTLDESPGAEIILDGDEVTIGRGPENHFVLKAEGVSRKHARFFPYDNRWYIEDTHSTNGITVNGEFVRKAMLNDGDVVQIGPVRYTFEIDAQPQESSEKTTLEFARGLPPYDPKWRPGNAGSRVGSDALLWSILVIGASAVMFAVFTIVSI